MFLQAMRRIRQKKPLYKIEQLFYNGSCIPKDASEKHGIRGEQKMCRHEKSDIPGGLPAVEGEGRFLRQLDDAYARVDRLFGGEDISEAVMASLTAAAVLIARGQCIRASFRLARGDTAMLGKDKNGKVRVSRRREKKAVRA